MKNPKILVASPVYEGMKYCIDEFMQKIINLTYKDYDVLIVDNSEGDDFFNYLKKYKKIILLKDNFSNIKKIANIVHSRNKIIDYALENNYDHVLMVDCDVIPPKNIIQELLKHKKDIVSGLYFNYFDDKLTKILPVAWRALTEEEFKELKPRLENSPLVKTNLDIRRHLTSEEIESEELLKVLIPSAGCMLLSKNVFKKVKYDFLIKLESGKQVETTDDVGFIHNTIKHGFESYCDTKLKCHHLVTGKWKKDSKGNLIHPAFD